MMNDLCPHGVCLRGFEVSVPTANCTRIPAPSLPDWRGTAPDNFGSRPRPQNMVYHYTRTWYSRKLRKGRHLSTRVSKPENWPYQLPSQKNENSSVNSGNLFQCHWQRRANLSEGKLSKGKENDQAIRN